MEEELKLKEERSASESDGDELMEASYSGANIEQDFHTMHVLRSYLEAKMDKVAHKKFPESVKSELEKGQIRKQARSYTLEDNDHELMAPPLPSAVSLAEALKAQMNAEMLKVSSKDQDDLDDDVLQSFFQIRTA